VRLLFALPDRDFDPTEAAVTWRILRAAGHDASFATPSGTPGQADPSMITGVGLDVWGRVPIVKQFPLVGLVLRANADARAAYALMERDPRYNAPLRYDDLRAADFDAIVLPGGHYARGMHVYLESPLLQAFVAGVFESAKPVAAICHGVLLAARSISRSTGRSVLYGRKTTALTGGLENAGAAIGRIVRFWEPNYYHTYVDQPGEPPGYRNVQSEVTRALAAPEDFLDVPKSEPDYRLKTDGLHRDTLTNARPAFVVRDGNYVSARWPGDAHTFGKAFADVLAGSPTVA
jgi:putative intracellular protease/amidase